MSEANGALGGIVNTTPTLKASNKQSLAFSERKMPASVLGLRSLRSLTLGFNVRRLWRQEKNVRRLRRQEKGK